MVATLGFDVYCTMKHRMKYYAGLAFFVLALLCVLLCTTVFAENVQYFYVNSDTGNDEADGQSLQTAVKTFTQACRFAEKSGADKVYIVVTNEYHFSVNATEIEHTVPFVVTTKDAREALKIAAGLVDMPEDEDKQIIIDANEDGEISTDDARYILCWAAGISTDTLY